MKPVLFLVVSSLLASVADAATLPGFRIERIGPVEGFPTSIAIDSAGRIFYTTIDGRLFRFDGSSSTPIAAVTTEGIGNSGLLGMALLDDSTAVVHYTTPGQTHDIVSLIDLRDGTETILHSIVGDIELPGRPTPSEHHGGNPSVTSDGTIFVPIGEYSWSFIAPDPRWNGGKIFRITGQRTLSQFARGLRNPFDVAWDETSQRLIVSDNGPTAGDEIHIIEEGADCGWPNTYGTLPPVPGTVPPDYVFPKTTVPTGLLLLNGKQPYLRRGFLLGGFMTRAVYYFADIDTRPLPEPFILVERETSPLIDIAQTSDGATYFVTGGFSPGTSAIYRLIAPTRGDCNGDGRVNSADYTALTAELAEGPAQRTTDVHGGATKSSWGCDANEDGMVTSADLIELIRTITLRRRAAGR